MSNTPSQTVLTNELKLHDYRGTKLSITFGDADINDGYSYARVNFRAEENKFDFSIDKPTLNFITDGLTINDMPVWNMFQQGPNTGMNADMVDGLHAYDLKDRLGSHHYMHMFNTSSKKFVKIATLVPRRVGNPPDFRKDGVKPYSGIFSKLELQDKIAEFEGNTINNLSELKPNSKFSSTDMVTEGIYNATLRATVTVLKNNVPTTADIHIGLFNDPLETSTDGWTSMKKIFYVSLHDNNLPYLPQSTLDTLSSKLEKAVKKIQDVEKMSNEINFEEDYNISTLSASTNDIHSRPTIDKSGYVIPPDPSKDYDASFSFPPVEDDNIGYDKYIETFRLYHVDSTTETIDGVQVVTNKFDLYMAIDEKAELHIQPYMSSSCLLYNFETPVSESSLPLRNYLRPKSIYDSRYAYKNHRHLNYEERIMHLIGEVDGLWDMFDNYVTINQGKGNAKKVMMTDNNGNVFAANDNFERHEDSRRTGLRVLATTASKCIAETSITLEELGNLEGSTSNIQNQINNLKAIVENLKQNVPAHNHDDRYLKLHDTAADSNKNRGKYIYVQKSQPTGQYVGDVWITW